jgi:hypothetical protein
MQHATSVVTTVLLGLTAALVARADDAEEIKKLVPKAAAISRQVFDTIAKGESVKPSDFDELSLTAVLLGAGPKLDSDGKAAKEEFEMFQPINVAGIAREISQVAIGRIQLPSPVVTAVHLNRITNFTCTVDGDTAKGTVSYSVPNLYRGKFAYVAKRKEGKWEIVEIAMPAHRVSLVRDEKGKWKKQ